jgi:hypothetical protein
MELYRNCRFKAKFVGIIEFKLNGKLCPQLGSNWKLCEVNASKSMNMLISDILSYRILCRH